MASVQLPGISDGFAAVIVTDRANTDASHAVGLAGGRAIVLGWDDAATGLARGAMRPVVLLEAQGLADATLERNLPRIDATAIALDLSLVVALDETQIDIVTSALMGCNVELLCAPTIADRVVALTLAVKATEGWVLSDFDDSEDARLKQLNAEVARIAEVLARLNRRDESAIYAQDIVADTRPGFDAQPAPEEDVDPAQVRRAIRSRRMRDQFFAPGLFEDPAWDILLDLFAAHLEQGQVSVSSLCIASAVAPTTALRWIGKLTESGLIERRPDPFDRRRAFVTLSHHALEGMRRYIGGVRRSGLPIV